MTLQEFSNEFDVFYNNVMSNQAPGINEYEKSVFLTYAQNELVDSYFNPKNNKQLEGFDGSNIKEMLLIALLSEVKIALRPGGNDSLNPNAFIGTYPDNVYSALSELAKSSDSDTKRYSIVQLSIEDYSKMMSKVSARPPKNIVWKIPSNGINSTETAEYLPPYGIELSEVSLRYIKQPEPIILPYVDAGLSIGEYMVVESDPSVENKEVLTDEGKSCMLPPGLHPHILRRAVELAKAHYNGELDSIVGIGEKSATGIAPMTIAELQARAPQRR